MLLTQRSPVNCRPENWLMTDQWQRVLASLVPFYFQCFFGFSQGARRQVVRSEERKTACRLFAVATIDPKLRVVAAIALIKAAEPTIAGVADWDKLREMIFENGMLFLRLTCGRGRRSFYCFTLHAVALAQAIFKYTYLSINSSESTTPGWRNWQTRQT